MLLAGRRPVGYSDGMSTDQTVYVIDDDDAMRVALERLLGSCGYQTRGFAEARTFLALDLHRLTGCVILDVRMPEVDGLSLQKAINAADVGLPLIFVSGHADVPLSVLAMKQGALTFLTKPFREQDLLDAVSEALALERSTRGERRERAEMRRMLSDLDDRERGIVDDIADGTLNKTIAAKLGLSEISVKVLRGRIMRKLGLSSAVQLARMMEKIRR